MNAHMSNPYIKGLVWFVGIVFAVGSTSVGVAFGFDERYSKKTDTEKAVKLIQDDLKLQAGKLDAIAPKLQQQMERNADNNRKRMLEDQVLRFDMTPEPQKSQVDRALNARYRTEIQELQRRWNRLGMPLQ